MFITTKLNGVFILAGVTIIFAIVMIPVSVQGLTQSRSIQDILLTTASLSLLISGIFIFKYREWARKLMIASYIYFIINTFSPLHYFITAMKNNEIPSLAVISMGLILFCANIFYFMRKTIRNKFTQSLSTRSGESISQP